MSVSIEGFVHVSERESGPWICCAPCSGAMVAHYVVGTPASLTFAHRIRSSIGLPHAGGLKPSELRAGVKAATGGLLELEVIPVTRDAIAEQLRAGWAIAVALTAGKLPTRLRRWSPAFAGGHMAVLAGISAAGESWGWWDPLAPAGWAGEWIAPGDVMPALWTEAGSAAGAMRRPEVFQFGIERWAIDGDPTKLVTTLGVPLKADGTPDWSQRLAYLSDAGGANPRLEPFPRARLTGAGDPTGVGAQLAAALARFALPPGVDELEVRRLEWDRWHEALGIPPRP